MDIFPPEVRRFWNKWELRTLVIISLSIIFGSIRKRTSNKILSLTLWLGYLMADWTATLALGVLSNNQGDNGDSDSDNSSHPPPPPEVNHALVAFWVPFLLVHLGGPDNITAFSLEDNELWLRHLLGLIFQAVVACYVFIRSLPDKHVWVPTIPMFMAGINKYGERTWALMLASRDNFRDTMIPEPDPGPNYAKFMEEYSCKKNAGLDARMDWEKEPEVKITLPADNKEQSDDHKTVSVDGKVEVDMQLLSDVLHSFHIFKRLIVDLILTFHDRNKSQSYFLNQSWARAFKFVEIELGYVYEVLYTKTAVAHTHRGCILRKLSISSIIVAFSIFFFDAA